MGTYCSVVLLDKSSANINLINLKLFEMGYGSTFHNKIMYGAFYSNGMLKEDIRFMNEEIEGKKQMPHIPRPITKKALKENGVDTFFKIGVFEIKLSGGRTKRELNNAYIVGKWAMDNKHLIDIEESYNYEPSFIEDYMVD